MLNYLQIQNRYFIKIINYSLLIRFFSFFFPQFTLIIIVPIYLVQFKHLFLYFFKKLLDFHSYSPININ